MTDSKHSKQVFSDLYENFGFGSTETRSGPGSTLTETEKLRIKIIDLIKKYNIKSITDFPCGDLNWMQHIFEYVDKYSGCDIVEECITTNKSRFPNLDFYCLDLSKDTIPTSDLLIVLLYGTLMPENSSTILLMLFNSFSTTDNSIPSK